LRGYKKSFPMVLLSLLIVTTNEEESK
jgi:hypothetical protein